MNLIFRHNMEIDEFPQYNKGTRSTVALEKPHCAEILQKMRQRYTDLTIPKIVVNIGASKVHYKDHYNKKLGRELATSRLKPVEMTIENHSSYCRINGENNLYLILTGVDKDLKIQYYINVKIYQDSLQMRVMQVFTRSWE